MRVTPGFSPDVAGAQSRGSICPHGEVVAVTAANRAPDGDSAGTTKAGIHTFNYRFRTDPALALKSGIEEALRRGGCRTGTTAATNLHVAIQQIEARGLECGFASCEGKAESLLEAKLLDGAGHAVLEDTVTSSTTLDCGLVICNEKEASEMASEVLSQAISRTVDKFAKAITKQLTPQPSTPASTTSQPTEEVPGASEAVAPPS